MNVDYWPESRFQNKAESEFLQQFKRGNQRIKRDPIFIQVEDQHFNSICIMKISFSKIKNHYLAQDHRILGSKFSFVVILMRLL